MPLETKRRRIFYLGTTEHTNLGDLAQYFCIREWIAENYPEEEVIEFGAVPVVYPYLGFVRRLRKIIRPCDMIVFQSGYTTHDGGGYHEYMHRLIIDNIPEARILMMPQTVFFRKKENRQRTARSYNRARKMLFLARDRISYEAAREMFPDVAVKLFPDIVTTRIGQYRFNNVRDRVLFCCRNDREKFYSEAEIADLRRRVEGFIGTDFSDTTSHLRLGRIKKNLKRHIEQEIEKFSKYRVTITDRYHGTIFSLSASTPVVILRTTDHKVITGAEWFEGVYDDYVYVAESLEHALELTEKIVRENRYSCLQPHFKREYYDKLKELFDRVSIGSKARQ